MGPQLQQLVTEIHDEVRAKAPSHPAGAMSFALPAMPVLPLIEATARLALDQVVAQFGVTVEQALLSHGDVIRSVVSDNLLGYVAKVATDLRQATAPQSPQPAQ